MQSLIYSVFASLQVCWFQDWGYILVLVYIHVLQNESNIVLFFFSCACVWSQRWMSGSVSWEDFCCVVAPSRCTISKSPGRERPGIWRDHPRLAHKSLPWGLRQNSDIITLRPSVLWSGWQCSSTTVLSQLIWAGSTLWYNTSLPKLPWLFNICITWVNVSFQGFNLFILATVKM